ncbi:MAG: deoxyribonuclease IV [Thermodesulfovibrionia bacterium]|nr:deoxyribonuclease IV [Thermodesulfovibrionia bacterium]
MRLSSKTKVHDFKVGVHTSIAGGMSKSIERAVSLQCTTMQIFSHNPRQWRKSQITREEGERFAVLRKKYDISPVFIHASYLINLASRSDSILHKSIKLLSYELTNADTLGVEYVVLHTGSANGENEENARNRAVKAILKAVSNKQYTASLLLENTAGQRGDITSSIKTLSEIIDTCHSDRIAGICIDTCHAFSSGYDLTSYEGIETLISEIKEYVGLDKLKLIHLNDSKRPLGSGVDRHEHIGKGFIGNRGFKKILSDKRIARIPMILETPKKTEADDKRNLKTVFSMIMKGQKEING